MNSLRLGIEQDYELSSTSPRSMNAVAARGANVEANFAARTGQGLMHFAHRHALLDAAPSALGEYSFGGLNGPSGDEGDDRHSSNSRRSLNRGRRKLMCEL